MQLVTVFVQSSDGTEIEHVATIAGSPNQRSPGRCRGSLLSRADGSVSLASAAKAKTRETQMQQSERAACSLGGHGEYLAGSARIKKSGAQSF